MDKKLLLIKAVTLLYRESQIEESNENSSDIVQKIVDDVELPEVGVGVMDNERETLIGLKTLATEMAKQDVSHKYVNIELLQKIRHACGDDTSLYDSFREGIESELSEDDLKRFCLNIRHEINEYFRKVKYGEILQKAAYDLKFNPDKIKSVSEHASELTTNIEPFQSNVKDEDPGIVGEVTLSDVSQVKNVFTISRQLNDERGILRFGWQGLNRMMQGGIRRGEFGVVGALQHNFKTGFSLSTFKHLAIHNKPYLINPNKKPLLLRITFEDPLSLNLPFLYRNIYENKTKQLADLKNVSDEDIAKYVSEQLSVNGFEIMMLHVNPSLWTYRDICNKVLQLEAMGFEVVALWLDYLAMVPTTGCFEGGPIGSAMRDMYRRMRNFMAAKKIAVLTPHQLSTEAKMLIRNGLEETFVKEIANKGYYDGCRTLDQEVDFELYIHIVKVDGKSYLTIQRGKHRVIRQTPLSDLYCVLPFNDIGDIRDDVDGVDSSTKRPGATRNAETGQEEAAFWDFAKPT